MIHGCNVMPKTYLGHQLAFPKMSIMLRKISHFKSNVLLALDLYNGHIHNKMSSIHFGKGKYLDLKS